MFKNIKLYITVVVKNYFKKIFCQILLLYNIKIILSREAKKPWLDNDNMPYKL